MKIRQIHIQGFKSFADRTVFDFDEGISAIVGPNGCGKSNVVDAVRWVLGETRPTSMRGGEMADVIFKGSVSRPAMSVAEATMVLDNSGGELEAQGPRRQEERRSRPLEGEEHPEIDGEGAAPPVQGRPGGPPAPPV